MSNVAVDAKPAASNRVAGFHALVYAVLSLHISSMETSNAEAAVATLLLHVAQTVGTV